MKLLGKLSSMVAIAVLLAGTAGMTISCGSSCCCASQASNDGSQAAITASELAQRVLGNRAGAFEFRQLPSVADNSVTVNKTPDTFTLTGENGKIVISGNNANSMAVGLNYYLKYYCGTEVGWLSSDKPLFPKKFPAITEPFSAEARCSNRFFLNYCTYGYTMPWWNWEEWEHFIDWMALNGVNLPLAITGQESIWQKVWISMGLSDEEVRNYFVGPAHLPWHRMINMDYWGGPLPQSWLDGQHELQKKIVKRERELDMKPVLPAFAGHVPKELKRIYPNAKINPVSPWLGKTEAYACSFLDPMDPLFLEIQKRFLETEMEEYGTDHIYGVDLFNEVHPQSWEPDYLARVSREVYATLSKVDEDAVWLQMTWLFYYMRNYWTNDRIEPYITAIPKDKSLLLDYFCEKQEVWKRTEQFFGVPYIWCYLGNFGGNNFIAGDLSDINEKIENAFVAGGDNFSGLGATLEGFDCNQCLYDFVFEKAWNFPQHKDMAQWVDALADQRSGVPGNAKAREAWKILADEIYVAPTNSGQAPPMFCRPFFQENRMSKLRYGKPEIKYDNARLLQAVKLLLEADGRGDAYEFDVVNLTSQVLGNYSAVLVQHFNAALGEGDLTAMLLAEKQLNELFDDVDRLLGTQTFFLLGKWIEDARSWGVDEAEKNYFEMNARNLITTWGDEGNKLSDYAMRTYAGMVPSFYKVRWQIFFDEANAAVKEGRLPDYEGYHKAITTFEGQWWRKPEGKFASAPKGNPVKTAKELVAKYQDRIIENSK